VVQQSWGWTPDGKADKEREEKAMPTTCQPLPVLMPTIRQVVDVFEALESGLGYLEFKYVPQRKTRRSCPSVDADRADTRYSAAGEDNPSLVRAYVPHGGAYGDEGGYWIFENKAGETLIRLRSMDRQAAGDGYHKNPDGTPMVRGQYLWRSYLVGGIKLDTVKAVVGSSKTRLFPNAPEGFRWGR